MNSPSEHIFLQLHRQKCHRQTVDEKRYNLAINTLIDRVSEIVDPLMRKSLNTGFSLAVLLDPLIILLIYQHAVINSYTAKNKLPPAARPKLQNLPALSTLEKVAEIRLHTPYSEALRWLVQQEKPLEAALQCFQQASHANDNLSISVGLTNPVTVFPSGKRVLVTLGFSGFERAVLKLALPRLKFLRSKHAPMSCINLNARTQLLQKLRTIHPSSHSEQVILAYFAFVLPTAYFEEFAELLPYCLQYSQKTKAILSGVEFMRRPETAICMALIKAGQGKIIAVQHGGLYGQTDPTWQERAENRYADHYFTWGYAYRQNHLPLPAVRLSRKLPDLWQSNPITPTLKHRILLVAPYFSEELSFAIHSPSIANQYTAFSHSLRAIQPLTKKGYRIDIRLHPRNTITQVVENLMARDFHSCKVLAGKRGTLTQDSKAYDLIVFSAPNATGLAECLARKIPIAILAREQDYWLQENARPYYQALIDYGFWIRSDFTEEKLIKLLDRYHSSPEIAAFKKQFARNSYRYLGSWIHALKKVTS